MIIQSIKIEQFRHLATDEYHFDPMFNLIVGQNASGKTSLLEAIYYLSHLRSFRTNQHQQMIEYDEHFFRLIAHVSSDEQKSLIGIERNKQEVIVRKDYQTVNKRSLLAKLLPILFIGPDSGQLLMSGPKFRRQFIDWGLFQNEPNYHHIWMRFERALRQRNAALKARMSDSIIQAIEKELSEAGDVMNVSRETFIQALMVPLRPLLQSLVLEEDTWSISYHKGFSSDAYQEELEKSRIQDRLVGYTRNGPHRSDFILNYDGKNVGSHLSRGQIKLATIALMLAQIVYYREKTAQPTILLMDDITAELDQNRRKILLEVLVKQRSQLFVTCLEKSEFPLGSDPLLIPSMSYHKLTDGKAQKVVQ